VPYNPFVNVRITGTWENHASYSLGGTDLPTGYGTAIPAPASGILRSSGGSGEYAAGWIGSAGRRSVLSLDTPIYRHSPRRSSPFEAEGPMTAIVLQHQSAFGGEGHYREGQTCGWTGASANGVNYGGDVHLHWHGLDARGNRLRIESFLPASGTAGTSVTPVDNSKPEPPKDEDLMIRIQSTNRGIALVGAGYYRGLTSNEEVIQSGEMITAHHTGNDRQFDLWASMAVGGLSATTYMDRDILAKINLLPTSSAGMTEPEAQRFATMIAQQVAGSLKFPNQFTIEKE